jgi:hypothetical protein
VRRRTTTLLACLTCVCAVLAGLPHGAEARASRPPIVMIVFDEFPTISLLDRMDHVDPIRYPNFAQLAGSSTWFSDATASVDETGRAMAALLQGYTPRRRNVPPSPVNFPHNLFALLGRAHYRFRASEEVTGFCPPRFCPGSHIHTRSEVLHRLAGGRPERFESWVRALTPSRHPTLYYKHVLLPHVPLRYLPSGRHYASGPREVLGGITRAFHNPWPVTQIYQRHLLQLGFTDRLLGDALRRLRATGLWNRSLVIVTADNGESFGRFGDRHVITPRHTAEIALTPLFVKRPFQRSGRTVRKHVRTTDVLPTVQHLLGLPRGAREGHSVFGGAARRIPSSFTMSERNGGSVHVTFRQLRRRAAALLRRKLSLFQDGDDGAKLYWIGPHPLLLGHPTSLWPQSSRGAARARFNGARAFRSVRLGSNFIPSMITGRISGDHRRRPRDVAVAVNGWIAATAPTFRLHRRGSELFSLMVPETAFHNGANRVQLFQILRSRSGIRLRDL